MAEPADKTWEDYRYEGDDISWYERKNPTYVGDEPNTPEELEAARRFISHWLTEDNHGFRIPDGVWGRALLRHLGNIVAHTGPYVSREEWRRMETERLAAEDAAREDS